MLFVALYVNRCKKSENPPFYPRSVSNFDPHSPIRSVHVCVAAHITYCWDKEVLVLKLYLTLAPQQELQFLMNSQIIFKNLSRIRAHTSNWSIRLQKKVVVLLYSMNHAKRERCFPMQESWRMRGMENFTRCLADCMM